MKARGAKLTFHYLDDFIVIGAPVTKECANSLEILLSACKELGIPVAAHKCTGPTTCLVFLGILIDMVKMEISLSKEKLERLKRILGYWRIKKTCTRRELESLIGHLQHAAKVVRPDRRFIRGMLSLLQIAAKPHHYVRLNASFRADLHCGGIHLSHLGMVCLFSANLTGKPLTQSSLPTLLDHGVVQLYGETTGSSSSGHPYHLLHLPQLPPKSYSQSCSLQAHGDNFGEER